MSDSQELFIVPCRSAFPRYEENDAGERIPQDVSGPRPPARWGNPSVKYRVDVPVVASSPDEAHDLAMADERVGEPTEVEPFVAEYVGEIDG